MNLTKKIVLTFLALAVLSAGVVFNSGRPDLSGWEWARPGPGAWGVWHGTPEFPWIARPVCALSETPETPHDQALEALPGEPPVKPRYSRSHYDITRLARDEVARLTAKLDPESYRVTQKAGTEPPFCGNLLDNKKRGVYCCIVCGLPLFSSEHKFDSGTGWPSFFQPVDPEHLEEREDRSLARIRTEIVCTRCEAHLGHVFDDGPPPTGQRHCLNSAALRFHEKAGEGWNPPLPPGGRPVETAVAYFAGGCFWGIEHYFNQGPGVVEALSGYMQGEIEHPTYEQVCTGTTGHAETVKVIYDPNRITYRRLLEAFFDMHDPTQLNRQGADVGSQYRSGIWSVNAQQQQEAEHFIRALQESGRVKGRIVTQVQPAGAFWLAEAYHQRYIERTGRACHVADPW